MKEMKKFVRFDKAILMFHKYGVDYILHARDIFDHSVLDQEVWL